MGVGVGGAAQAQGGRGWFDIYEATDSSGSRVKELNPKELRKELNHALVGAWGCCVYSIVRRCWLSGAKELNHASDMACTRCSGMSPKLRRC